MAGADDDRNRRAAGIGIAVQQANGVPPGILTLDVNGFEVTDVGVDVPPARFVEATGYGRL
jgi:hypothetical protein